MASLIEYMKKAAEQLKTGIDSHDECSFSGTGGQPSNSSSTTTSTISVGTNTSPLYSPSSPSPSSNTTSASPSRPDKLCTTTSSTPDRSLTNERDVSGERRCIAMQANSEVEQTKPIDDNSESDDSNESCKEDPDVIYFNLKDRPENSIFCSPLDWEDKGETREIFRAMIKIALETTASQLISTDEACITVENFPEQCDTHVMAGQHLLKELISTHKHTLEDVVAFNQKHAKGALHRKSVAKVTEFLMASAQGVDNLELIALKESTTTSKGLPLYLIKGSFSTVALVSLQATAALRYTLVPATIAFWYKKAFGPEQFLGIQVNKTADPFFGALQVLYCMCSGFDYTTCKKSAEIFDVLYYMELEGTESKQEKIDEIHGMKHQLRINFKEYFSRISQAHYGTSRVLGNQKVKDVVNLVLRFIHTDVPITNELDVVEFVALHMACREGGIRLRGMMVDADYYKWITICERIMAVGRNILLTYLGFDLSASCNEMDDVKEMLAIGPSNFCKFHKITLTDDILTSWLESVIFLIRKKSEHTGAGSMWEEVGHITKRFRLYNKNCKPLLDVVAVDELSPIVGREFRYVKESSGIITSCTPMHVQPLMEGVSFDGSGLFSDSNTQAYTLNVMEQSCINWSTYKVEKSVQLHATFLPSTPSADDSMLI